MILGLESSGIKLTADIVKAKILQDVKVCESQSGSSEEAFYSNPKAQKGGEKSSIKCYRCNKLDHYASECKQQGERKRSTKPERDGKQCGHAAFFAAYNTVEACTRPEEWIFDSGATTHLCRNRSVMQEATSMSGSNNVANNSVVPVVAKGSVKLDADCDGKKCELSISNVLCVPELAINLMSVSKICSNGYQVVFNKESCKVLSPEKEIVAIGKKTGGLYKLKVCTKSANLAPSPE
ncbi:uncharacterized protein LOC129742874 [Uranotaenia lowii]|uniref:uncharacterized protein LOC129742874 n=1 Tax=Uranotaenia lowii TaxID=190385 RepID=UPI00247AFBBD|nr:uncharacterized protein LOC129742874 [Uranotaenia lowii]